MAERRIGLIMNGVTGRMGMNQHLIRSIAAIRAEGGMLLANGDRLMPDPIIVGRNRQKLEALARAHGVERVSTDLDACLANPEDTVFFDAATTQMRAGLIRRAIAAGKHIYCEKVRGNPAKTDKHKKIFHCFLPSFFKNTPKNH
jgi:predicted dehydrogenase